MVFKSCINAFAFNLPGVGNKNIVVKGTCVWKGAQLLVALKVFDSSIMETATTILQSFDSVLGCFELCTKHELLKIGVIIISLILGTIDMVTDWINLIQWRSVGGYAQHASVDRFQSVYLYPSSSIGRSKMNKLKKKQKSEHTYLSATVVAVFTVNKVLGALMEDLPVVILMYYSVVLPFCGVPANQERYLSMTIAAVVSSMLNSMWTIFMLYWDLILYNNNMSDAQCCCTVIRSVYEPQTLLSICYCGCCACATTYDCECLCLGRSGVEKNLTRSSKANVQGKCARNGVRIQNIKWFGIICLPFLPIFIVGGMTVSNVFDAAILDRSGLAESEFTRSIKADKIGAGLDSGTDAAMFITMVYELPNWYHVGLYDNRNVNIANSASVSQIHVARLGRKAWCLDTRGFIPGKIQWHIHAGSWSLVNCWWEALTRHYIRCS